MQRCVPSQASTWFFIRPKFLCMRSTPTDRMAWQSAPAPGCAQLPLFRDGASGGTSLIPVLERRLKPRDKNIWLTTQNLPSFYAYLNRGKCGSLRSPENTRDIWRRLRPGAWI